ncbi:outer membrane receptor protein involved in Fe transport [Neolewinella xylanilytica]|uniref:Outer membrane receptor protein involved in Fe transport n=1 Tax=Neolewinella xylanilytica TaxID=1514080 RepID=A0A2S6I246_9BACT|nr:TonB-dependent receptor plug domain-containing protein [Neolewinella xylanilytica]PPK85256.1 outer membrane receptor protein involved in Fe transport [Neolewinella xylanilytica]
MTERIYLFFLTACFATGLTAQTVEGRVLSADRSPIIGAYIIHLNSEHHTHTNELGNFMLDGVAPGDSLQVTYLGYRAQKIEVPAADEFMEVELEESFFDLDAITVRPDLRSLNVATDIDSRLRPVNSAQDILRRVPGMIIGQHAGGGKAEQIFLRGFDIDHGTDVAISVEGMPVNMVSHAHGQGYADLHFLIPETIEKIDYGKGPYYADQGNFATAGYVDFSLKDKLDRSLLTAEVGSFNTLRAVGLFDLLNNERSSAYLATEYILTDGPFESSQHFNRLNLMGRYTAELPGGSKLSLLASHFESKWDASGQIPVRAVESGLIGRFGAIDDTEGGYTGRTNLAGEFLRVVNRSTFIKTNAYYSRYDFELFSNFTFFLEDPVNGDQIRQSEDREIFGFQSEVNHAFTTGGGEASLKGGIGLRYDNNDDVELSRTRNREELLERIQYGDIDESNLFAYAGADFEFGDLLINPAVRLDHFVFNYVDKLQPTYDRQEQRKTAVSPKLNFLYTLNDRTQLFLKTGVGFHANDTRVVLDQSAAEILPAAYGADLGGIFRPTGRLFLNAALWYLYLEQEFVYVGDAGIVEPSGETRRLGVDLSARYQLTDWLFADADLNYAFARSIGEPEGADYIPLAPDLTSSGGLNVLNSRWTGGVRYRYVANRPANEDNSIVAEGYFILDANVNYAIGPVSLGLVVENALDAEWNETQFATESRLFSETQPVEEIHFTPGAPFLLRGVVRYKF